MSAEEIRIPCGELGPAIDALVDLLGFRLDMIMPADDPTTAGLSGHGIPASLEAGAPHRERQAAGRG